MLNKLQIPSFARLLRVKILREDSSHGVLPLHNLTRVLFPGERFIKRSIFDQINRKENFSSYYIERIISCCQFFLSDQSSETCKFNIYIQHRVTILWFKLWESLELLYREIFRIPRMLDYIYTPLKKKNIFFRSLEYFIFYNNNISKKKKNLKIFAIKNSSTNFLISTPLPSISYINLDTILSFFGYIYIIQSDNSIVCIKISFEKKKYFP